jgi:hypothetical protein
MQNSLQAAHHFSFFNLHNSHDHLAMIKVNGLSFLEWLVEIMHISGYNGHLDKTNGLSINNSIKRRKRDYCKAEEISFDC